MKSAHATPLEVRPRILVAEDEVEIRGHIIEKIRELLPNARITEATNGTEAITKISMQKFDLVTTDLVMPRRDGHSVLLAISKILDPLLKPSHVMVISGQLLPFKSSGQLGTVITLDKPLDTALFQSHLRRLFALPVAQPLIASSQFLTPLIDAVLEVLPMISRVEPKRERVALRTPGEVSGDISAVVAVIGTKHVGSICVSFPKATFLNLIEKIWGHRHDSITLENQATAADICSQIFSSALTSLSRQGHFLQNATPSVIVNPAHTISHAAAAPCVVVHFNSSAGSFVIETAIQDL